MLVDGDGKVLYRKTSLLARETPKINRLLKEMSGAPGEIGARTLDGISYMSKTIERTGEMRRLKRRDRFPSLACGSGGLVHVAFTTNRNGNSDVFLRSFDGDKWLADRPVAASGADEYDPSLVVTRDGRIWVSWVSNAGGKQYDIFTASLKNPSDVISPVQVTNSEDDAMHARIACDSEGQIWVTYYKWHKLGKFSRDKEIYVRRYDGTKWSKETRVSPEEVPEYEDHSDPAIAAAGEDMVIAWSWDFHRPRGYTQDASCPTIFARSIGRDMQLGQTRAASGHSIDTTPAIVIDRKGRVFCAWDSFSGTGKSLRVCVFKTKAERFLLAPYELSSGLANMCTPSFALSRAGRVALVWSETNDGRIWVLKKAVCGADDNVWSKPETLVSEGNPRFPSAAYDSEGDLWVAYSAVTPAGREIRVKRWQGE
jgi:hypothetical protein